MDSDSDSDCSHISSTPPRNLVPSPQLCFSSSSKIKLDSLLSHLNNNNYTLNPIPISNFEQNPLPISNQSSKPIKFDPKPASDRSSEPVKDDQIPTLKPLEFYQKPASNRSSEPVKVDQIPTLKPLEFYQKPASNRSSEPVKVDQIPTLKPLEFDQKPASNRSSEPVKVDQIPTLKPLEFDQKPTSNRSSEPVKVDQIPTLKPLEFDKKPAFNRSPKRLETDPILISDRTSKRVKSCPKHTSGRPSKPIKSDPKPVSDRSSKPVKIDPKLTFDRSSKRVKIDPKPTLHRSSNPVRINPIPVQPDPPIPLNLPYQIVRKSGSNDAFCVENPVSVTAGGFCSSKFASFTKIQRSDFVFEPIEDDSTATKGTDFRVRVVKRHPNSIGGSSSQELPAKRTIKNVNEGNFVRLNINGYGGKSKFKGKGKYKSSSNRNTFRRGKRKFWKRGEDSEKKGDLDDDGMVSEKVLRSEEEEALIEEAVLGVRHELSDENLLKLLKVIHGYESFRDGQLEAIKMVLSGKSTMLVLPTGAGKSLCYQLPAMVLPGITLVVSPLVALMIDQLRQLPPMIGGGLLSSTQTLDEKLETLRLLQEGCIKVLFVSPERFLNEEFLSIFSTTVVSLLVVDEAHCVSEWSHNFRPSYMRLRASLLRTKLNVQCILAMTATATTKTLNNVMCALEIPSENLVKTSQWRDNLQLSVTVSRHRKNDLITLLKSPPYAEIKSIIIYCKYQAETDSISKYLRDNDISAKSYHSGIPPKDRNHVQKLFCSSKIKAVVATVAFGMGLDKRDIGAVIHYSLPESLEEYVQEIGRAGRDGRLSYCHLLFDESTYFVLRSLAYSDGVDEFSVSRFLSQIFTTDSDSHGKICSVLKESASRKFDMREEVMLTILTQLELGEVQYLQVLPQINVTCTLNFHQTTPALLAAKDLAIAAVLKKSDTKHGQYVFDVPTVANSIRVSALDIVNQLQILKEKGEITFEMKDPAYCYIIVDVPKDFFSLAAHITKWLSEVERCKVRKLDSMFNAAAFAVQECKKVNGCNNSLHTPCLQKKILDYFGGDDDISIPTKMEQNSRFLKADVKVFLQSNSQARFTPRAVARIMHGIASPAFPSCTWSKTHFWGRYMSVDFNAVMEAAKAELMSSNKTDRLLS